MKNAAKVQAPSGAAEDAGWRQFPKFEEILSSPEPPTPLLAKVEKTCRQLNDVLQSGSETDQSRARVAMAAYGRSLDLLRILTDARNKAAQA
jgi:hypothetical protein